MRRRLEAAEQLAHGWESMYHNKQRELVEMRDELTPKILRILEKIFKTQWKRHRPPSRRYCLMVEFDEQIIQDAFIQGDNRNELDYMANYIGHMVVRDIRQINFARFVDEPEERGYRVPTFDPTKPFKP